MRKKKEPPAPVATGFLVNDGKGGYQPTSPDSILAAARDVALQRMAKGTSLESPDAVRECLPCWEAIGKSGSACCFWTVRTG